MDMEDIDAVGWLSNEMKSFWSRYNQKENSHKNDIAVSPENEDPVVKQRREIIYYTMYKM